MAAPLTSVAGITALLDEQDPKLQAYALRKLDTLVDRFWAELADSVPRIEELYEDESFSDRGVAALVASKIYFYLGEFEDSLSFALGAGALFDVERKDEYVETVISKSIDQYIAERCSETEKIDPRLESIVNNMLQRCIAAGEYRQALGIALETHRLDVIENVFNSTHDAQLLSYVLEVVMGVSHAPQVRKDVLLLLVKLFQSLAQPDFFSIAQCYVYLNEPTLASELLQMLVKRAEKDEKALENSAQDPLMIAYQIAFDLVESATQEFLKSVQQDVQQKLPAAESGPGAWAAQIAQILSGEETIKFYRDFLKHANHADLAILKKSKDALDAHYSAYHSAVSLSNAFMNAGTASDQFLRENLEWLAKASNWSKFTATAALGVLHKGNLQEGMNILHPYLPSDAPSSSVYSEGGSLFALGLIHANHGAGILDTLINTLRNNTAEVVQHGAALGLGAAGMATENEAVYEELRNVLFGDSAVTGEAAGYAMGLVYLGTGAAHATEEMLQYAQETQHEKIIRGLAIGLALLNYGRESQADGTIDVLIAHKDATMRYGGVYTIALAYAGTGDNKSISRLLHLAVSDGSDDVRRAAVISLGFLLFRTPQHVPAIVQLLSESYNPHVRYGAAIALGVACAGTGLDAALDLLEPMTKDPVDFVRQGACMALAMILIQQNEVLNPRVEKVRKSLETIISEKHEEAMAKFGATLAQGLLDAGGRNATISLQGRGGSINTPAIVGMALFTQYWYWFPMALFASLSFTPTAIIGLSRTLALPDVELVSRARPSLFAYPPPVETPSEKKLEKVETAVLSTTAKSQARQRTKEKKKAQLEGEAMEQDEKPKTEEKPAEEEKPVKRPEPKEERIKNCSRVTPYQLKYVAFPPSSRFQPVRPILGNRADVWQDTAAIGALPALSTAPRDEEAATTRHPEPSQARQLNYSVTGGGGGILMLLDRDPSKPYDTLPLQGKGDDGKEDKTAEEDTAAAIQSAPDTDEKEATSVPGAESAPAQSEDVDMPEAPEAR
ncbi:proteasome regulatory particle base subunit [Malassezia japonica]|uniref:26S proteasome regulatory subunit RPN2 n=1 Tax=Malassezia japonica TaxID=223818 RepID=A0AAF0EWP9_9BASI|nr:proteasome regulatory particle base subunit [Malassezia japonica]WFD38391.1 proteasome regulatory particle base subunit [Malassezia japonica]